VTELSSYEFSPLRKGDFTLYRGSGDGLAPVLLVAADDPSRGWLARLEHDYALRATLMLPGRRAPSRCNAPKRSHGATARRPRRPADRSTTVGFLPSPPPLTSTGH
jgi:hypothetical protein